MRISNAKKYKQTSCNFNHWWHVNVFHILWTYITRLLLILFICIISFDLFKNKTPCNGICYLQLKFFSPLSSVMYFLSHSMLITIFFCLPTRQSGIIYSYHCQKLMPIYRYQCAWNHFLKFHAVDDNAQFFGINSPATHHGHQFKFTVHLECSLVCIKSIFRFEVKFENRQNENRLHFQGNDGARWANFNISIWTSLINLCFVEVK